MTKDNSGRIHKRTSSFRGDVLRLLTGSGTAQIISVFLAPILTRFFVPEAFGIAAWFAAVTSITGILACLRYEPTIVLPKDDRVAANLLLANLFISVITSALIALFIGLFGYQCLELLNMEQLNPYLWLIPLATLIQGLFSALNYWNTRTKEFINLSFSRASTSITSNAISIGCGLLGIIGGGSLIVAAITGQFAGSIVLGFKILRDHSTFIRKNVSLIQLWRAVKRYRKFPLLDGPAAVLNTISLQMPALLLGSFFCPSIAGFYALGYRLVGLPMNLLGSSIAQVFLQRAAEAQTHDRLPDVVAQTINKLVLLAGFPFLALMFIGPDLFELVFGEDWATAGQFVQILSPWLFFVFLGSPISSLLTILELQEVNLFFNLILAISRFLSLFLGSLLGSPFMALVLYSTSGAICWLALCLYLARKSGISPSKFGKMVFKNIFSALLCLGPLYISLAVGFPPVWNIIMTAVSLLIYSFFLLAKTPELSGLLCKQKVK